MIFYFKSVIQDADVSMLMRALEFYNTTHFGAVSMLMSALEFFQNTRTTQFDRLSSTYDSVRSSEFPKVRLAHS